MIEHSNNQNLKKYFKQSMRLQTITGDSKLWHPKFIDTLIEEIADSFKKVDKDRLELLDKFCKSKS